MPALVTPLINGIRYDFSSIEPMVNGIPVIGRAFSAIDYKHSLKPGSVKGAAAVRLGRTRGEYEAEGTLEMPKEEYEFLLAAIQASNPLLGYMEIAWDLTVSYADVSVPTITDKLLGCRISEDSDSHKTGPEGLTVRVSLDIQMLVRNGRSPVNAYQGTKWA